MGISKFFHRKDKTSCEPLPNVCLAHQIMRYSTLKTQNSDLVNLTMGLNKFHCDKRPEYSCSLKDNCGLQDFFKNQISQYNVNKKAQELNVINLSHKVFEEKQQEVSPILDKICADATTQTIHSHYCKGTLIRSN